jgi:hypothetical protein
MVGSSASNPPQIAQVDGSRGAGSDMTSSRATQEDQHGNHAGLLD